MSATLAVETALVVTSGAHRFVISRATASALAQALAQALATLPDPAAPADPPPAVAWQSTVTAEFPVQVRFTRSTPC